MEKVATLVTSRFSGSSYLNRVELQNGCLSLGHSNTFIPLTLGGSCIDKLTGKVDEEKLKENLNLAIDAYISRVDGCPMGNTTIKLYKGSECREYDEDLHTFLKGSRKQREQLKKDKPDLFSHYSKIWNIRKRHMVPDLPSNYIFFLKACYEPFVTILFASVVNPLPLTCGILVGLHY